MQDLDKISKDTNIKTLLVMFFLSGIFISMFSTLWQPFLISLGVSMAFLGLTQTLGGYFGVVSSIFGIIGGRLSDELGRKPLICFGTTLEIIALFIYILAWKAEIWLLLLLGVILMGLGSALIFPALDSIVAESVNKRRCGRAYAATGFFRFLPTFFVPTVSGLIVSRWGFITAFLIITTFQFAYLLLAGFGLRETVGVTAIKFSRFRVEFLKSLRRLFFIPIKLRFFYLVVVLDALSYGMGASILFGMLVKTYNFTVLQIGTIISISNLSRFICQLPVGWFIERHGSKTFIAVSQIIGICMVVGWLVSTTFQAFAAMGVLYGISATAWFISQKTFLASSLRDGQLGEAMGRVMTLRGIISFPAPIIGGLLYDRYGFYAPLLGNLLGLIITLILTVFGLHEPK